MLSLDRKMGLRFMIEIRSAGVGPFAVGGASPGCLRVLVVQPSESGRPRLRSGDIVTTDEPLTEGAKVFEWTRLTASGTDPK